MLFQTDVYLSCVRRLHISLSVVTIAQSALWRPLSRSDERYEHARNGRTLPNTFGTWVHRVLDRSFVWNVFYRRSPRPG